MDEPLSTLDEALNLQLQKDILRLHSELGFTLVYGTHNRQEAKALGNRILFLRHGQIEPANN
jgi:ABC-type sugar transport system ATPase subunit